MQQFRDVKFCSSIFWEIFGEVILAKIESVYMHLGYKQDLLGSSDVL